jgi:sigma-E factor negative regulatory protein RseA
MKARISELMDGELESGEKESAIASLREDRSLIDAWRTYHLIGDALRQTRALSDEFSARFAERLAQEPTVMAPGRLGATARERVRRIALPMAASFAAVALVAWLALSPGPGSLPVQAPLAQSGQTAPVAQAPASVPLPETASDYMLAHQAYSPSVALQGMAPYARTVSSPIAVARPR